MKILFNIPINDRSYPLNIQATELNITLYFHGKQNSEVDKNYIYSIPVLLVWYFLEVYNLYFDPYCLHSQRVKLHDIWVCTMKCRYDLTMQFYWQGTCTCIVGWPSG